MRLYASQIDCDIYENLEKEYNLSFLQSELDIVIENSADSKSSALLFQDATPGYLINLSINPCKAFIEIAKDIEKNKKVISNLNQKAEVFLSIRAISSFDLPLSSFLVSILKKRISISDLLKDKILTSVNEVLLEVLLKEIYPVKSKKNTHEFYQEVQRLIRKNKEHQARISLECNFDEEKIYINLNIDSDFLNIKLMDFSLAKSFCDKIILNNDSIDIIINR